MNNETLSPEVSEVSEVSDADRALTKEEKRAIAQAKAAETKKVNALRVSLEQSIEAHEKAIDQVVAGEIVSDDDLIQAEKRVKREQHHIRHEKGLLALDREAMAKAADYFAILAKRASGNDKLKIGALSDAIKSGSPIGKRNSAAHNLLIGLSYFSDKEKSEIRYGEMAQFDCAVGSSMRTTLALFEALKLVERVKVDGRFVSFRPSWDNENLRALLALYD